jgi:hypothetical protein
VCLERRYSVLSDPHRRRKYDVALLGEGSLSTGQHGDHTVALWEAANRGDPDALDAAYRRGGRVAWRNPGEDGRTAMHAASRGGHVQCIKLLVDLGADVKVDIFAVRVRKAKVSGLRCIFCAGLESYDFEKMRCCLLCNCVQYGFCACKSVSCI